jgi:hypothetical protein
LYVYLFTFLCARVCLYVCVCCVCVKLKGVDALWDEEREREKGIQR